MNKYIDAEQLKAEIDKRYAEYRAKMKTDDFTYYEGMADALDHFEQYIDSLQQEQPKSTCKTCGFYENNCPFIRGKLIPYPNKVCKDYTYSAMKEQEQLGAPLHGRVCSDGGHVPGLIVDSAQFHDHLKGFPDNTDVDIFIIAKEDK